MCRYVIVLMDKISVMLRYEASLIKLNLATI